MKGKKNIKKKQILSELGILAILLFDDTSGNKSKREHV